MSSEQWPFAKQIIYEAKNLKKKTWTDLNTSSLNTKLYGLEQSNEPHCPSISFVLGG